LGVVYTDIYICIYYIHSDIGKSHFAVGDRQRAWSERDGLGGEGKTEGLGLAGRGVPCCV